MYKLDHIAIYAKEPVALCKWYREVLNLEIVRDLIDINNRPFYFLKSKNSKCTIEILATTEEKKERKLKEPGLSHICFLVVDFDKAVSNLESKGIRVHDIRTTKHGWRIGYFEDPEGNIIEIVKR